MSPAKTESAQDAADKRSSRELGSTQTTPPHGPRQRSSDGPAVIAWRELGRREYRRALRSGVLRPGIALEKPLVHDRPSVVFIHGGGGAPGQFAALADALHGGANVGTFLYNDTARLAPPAGLLGDGLLSLPGPVAVVAYSIGTLLPAYVGASDLGGRLREVAAVYLNPLIGGSRYADADGALALLGDLPGLQWLHAVKSAMQRVFFPAIVQDLTPEGDFQQAIFGSRSHAPSFATRTLILFTERPGKEPDIREDRVLKFFARSRRELVERMGRVVPAGSVRRAGHAAPLTHPELVLPLVAQALDRAGSRGPRITKAGFPPPTASLRKC